MDRWLQSRAPYLATVRLSHELITGGATRETDMTGGTGGRETAKVVSTLPARHAAAGYPSGQAGRSTPAIKVTDARLTREEQARLVLAVAVARRGVDQRQVE